jgi:hypothetical protein
MPPRQNQYDSDVLAASTESTWRLRQQCAMKTSIPVNCPWGSARSCRMAPVHFQPPIAGPVLRLHVCAPLPVPRGLPATGPACSQESCRPGEPPWGSTRSSREAPIHFWPHFAAQFRVTSCARARPKAAVVDDEGVSLPGELFRPTRCRPPPRSSPRGPWSLFLRPRPD